MKRFRSKVTALLDIRRRREEDILQAHAKTLQARQGALDRLNAISGALDSLRSEIHQAMTAGCSAAVLSQFQGYGARLNADRTAAAETLAQADAAVASSLEKVLGAKRDRESVEKFRSRERAEYDRESLREEQKLLDEIALRRAANPWSRPVAA